MTFKQNKHWAVHRWRPWLFFLFYSFLSASAFFRGSLPSQSYKANRVVWTRGGMRVNTGCCDVCGEWVTVCGGHSWYWACGAIFFSCRARCFEKPGPPTRASPVKPWQLNKWPPMLLKVTFDPWALSCPAVWGCLRSLPGSITSLPSEQLKRLAV